MNDVPDPTGGWARAAEATAEATKEGIQASRELAHFISGPFRELVGMFEDHLKVVRFERLIRLMDRVRNILVEKGLPGPTRKIPLSIAVPLLESATLEQNDDLQEIWARLLVNGGDASSGIELRRAFVSVLVEMTTLDVRNLTAIELASPVSPDGSSNAVWACKLPEEAISAYFRGVDAINNDPSVEVLTSLSNLERLGCIYSSGDDIRSLGVVPLRTVALTPFGRAFIEACTR